MALSARSYRLAAWACCAGAVISLVLMAVSVLTPWVGASGEWGGILGHGSIAVGKSSHNLIVDWPEGVEYPLWQFAGTNTRAQVWAPARWRPSHSDLVMTIAAAPPVTHTFDMWWLPLWWPVLFFSGAALALARLAQLAAIPGRCRACGYDVRGLSRNVCPECGRVAMTT
ncbi:MAG: hypothetical protein ACREJO_02605 [Phycisphaerales bacterium]